MATAGWSGFWNYTYDDGHNFIGTKAVRRSVGRALHGYGRKGYNAVLESLVSGAVGDMAHKDYNRVASQNPADPMTLGGKRGIENKVAMNRVTTANDVTVIIDDLDFDNSPKPWPVDKSGNGGGGQKGL